MSESLPPARPHLRFTPEGRRMREVLSYARRGSRLTPRQQRSWDAHAADWVIPEEAVDDPGFRLADWFAPRGGEGDSGGEGPHRPARSAPLIVEIGCGIGEATGPLAAARPDHDVLALEVWRPGVAAALGNVAAAGASNVRFCSVDAVWTLEHLLAPESIAELWTFYPDPWPKTRHHKRRLVTPAFARLVGSRLAPGAAWRLATDWQEYAERMVAVLDAEPALTGGVVERWPERPSTRFERRGIEAGRPLTDLCYRRRGLDLETSPAI